MCRGIVELLSKCECFLSKCGSGLGSDGSGHGRGSGEGSAKVWMRGLGLGLDKGSESIQVGYTSPLHFPQPPWAKSTRVNSTQLLWQLDAGPCT